MQNESENILWFVLFAAYGKVSKIRTYLREADIEYFFPMCYKEKRLNGSEERTKQILQPVLNNFIFVKSSKKILTPILETIKKELGITSDLYYRDFHSKQIVVVPEEQMRNFIKVASEFKERIIYLSTNEVAMKQGTRVRIIGGAFEGVEGNFMRIKGDRRVVVSLPSILSVATAFVPLEYIMPLE